MPRRDQHAEPTQGKLALFEAEKLDGVYKQRGSLPGRKHCPVLLFEKAESVLVERLSGHDELRALRQDYGNDPDLGGASPAVGVGAKDGREAQRSTGASDLMPKFCNE